MRKKKFSKSNSQENLINEDNTARNRVDARNSTKEDANEFCTKLQRSFMN